MNRIEVLQKLATGEITVDEAERLLKENAEALSENPVEQPIEQPVKAEAEAETSVPHAEPQAEPAKGYDAGRKSKSGSSASSTSSGGKPHWLKIRVGSMFSKQDYVKVNIPLGLVNAGVLFGSRIMGDKHADAWNQFLDSVGRGEVGTILEVEDEHDGERVRIYVE